MQHIIVSPAQMGSVLAAGRKRAGLTQTQAAARFGISQSRISTIERSTGAISLDQLLAMLGTYGLELIVQDRPELHELHADRIEW
jgi:HTH-type transcriptional regulator / antitoxin HipB